MPRPFLWDSAEKSEYPGVRVFAQKLKSAIMAAHDSILAVRVKQIRAANRRRQITPFKEKDLVYISTKDISFPKGLARKLVPKYIGPYPILNDFGNNSYRIGLSRNLRQRGVHDVFHAALLRIHLPNDDRLFPGRMDNQIWEVENAEEEWAVSKINAHSGSKENAIFEVVWKAGDSTWFAYDKISHLTALQQYFEALGVRKISQLPEGKGVPPKDDIQVLLGNICLKKSIKTSKFLPPKFPSSRFSPPRNNHLSRKQHSKPSINRRRNSHRSKQHRVDKQTSKMAPRFQNSEPSIDEKLGCLRYDHNTNMIILTGNDGRIHHYHPCQIQLFCLFDAATRNNKSAPTPGGYYEFASVFNDATKSKSGFIEWNQEMRAHITNRRRVSTRELDVSMFTTTGGMRDPGLEILGIVDSRGHTKLDSLSAVGSALIGRVHTLENQQKRSEFHRRNTRDKRAYTPYSYSNSPLSVSRSSTPSIVSAPGPGTDNHPFGAIDITTPSIHTPGPSNSNEQTPASTSETVDLFDFDMDIVTIPQPPVPTSSSSFKIPASQLKFTKTSASDHASTDAST